MAFTFVQGNTGNGNAASVAVALPANATAGNHIFVVVGTNDATGITVTDNHGNTYHGPVDAFDASNPAGAIFWATNIVGGALTVTVAFTVTPFIGVAVGEFHHTTAGAVTLGAHAAPASGSSAAPSSSSITPTAGSLLIGGLTQNTSNAQTAGSGWLDGSTHELNSANGTQSIAEEYQLSAAGTSVAATWTASFSMGWDATVAEFVPPSAAAAALPPGQRRPSDRWNAGRNWAVIR